MIFSNLIFRDRITKIYENHLDFAINTILTKDVILTKKDESVEIYDGDILLCTFANDNIVCSGLIYNHKLHILYRFDRKLVLKRIKNKSIIKKFFKLSDLFLFMIENYFEEKRKKLKKVLDN